MMVSDVSLQFAGVSRSYSDDAIHELLQGGETNKDG